MFDEVSEEEFIHWIAYLRLKNKSVSKGQQGTAGKRAKLARKPRLVYRR